MFFITLHLSLGWRRFLVSAGFPFREEISLRDDPILGHFDLVHTAKRKKEPH
jgi:hypothetical protein